AELHEAAAVAAEGEQLAALDEERPALLQLRLERREVDDRGIDLDLAEVGVEAGVERQGRGEAVFEVGAAAAGIVAGRMERVARRAGPPVAAAREDRKSTRLNSSHVAISYAVFCLKKKKM